MISMRSMIFMASVYLFSSIGFSATLTGQWKTLCKAQKSHSELTQVSFDGADLKYEITTFSDSKCTRALKNTVWMSKHEIFRENRVLPYWKINLSFRGIHLRALTSEQVLAYNNQSYCGYNNWKMGEFKEVSGLRCADHHYKEKGFKAYNVLRQEENKLVFDIKESAPSAVQRPSRPRQTTFYSL